MEDDQKIDLITKALGNETRRKILFLLSQRQDYPFSLANRLNISPRAIMQNLNNLEEAGLIEKYQQKSDQGPERTYYRIKKGLHLTVSLSPRSYRIKISELPIKFNLDLPDLESKFIDLKESSGKTNSDQIIDISLDLLTKLENKIQEVENIQCGLMRFKDEIFKEIDKSFADIDSEFPLTTLIRSILEMGGKSDIFDLLEYHKISKDELQPLIDLANKLKLIKKRRFQEDKEYYMF